MGEDQLIEEEPLRNQIARAIRDAMEKFGLSGQQAAEELGITRASICQYLAAKSTPGGDVLVRAILKWDLTITIGDRTVGTLDGPKRPHYHDAQLRLFDP